MDPARKKLWMIWVSRGHPIGFLSYREHMQVISGHWIMTGACGPYNLGGSTIEWYQSDHCKGFCSIVLQKLQNDLE